MGTKESKQYIHLGGMPIVVRTLAVFEQAAVVDEVVLVVGADDVAACEQICAQYGLRKVRAVIAGGKERQHSVHEGLKRMTATWVLVHDGVRPFVTEDVIVRSYEAAKRYGGAVAAVPVKDTIKSADSSGRVTATPDRSTLWAVQTPQAFERDALLKAHERALKDAYIGTDDASVAEYSGIPVQLVLGDYANIKITTPDDLAWAEYYIHHKLAKRS